jgi:SAM-dependent methyltransferase
VSTPADRVAIIGAGTSALLMDLVDAGYRTLYAVDISDVALDQLRSALGERAETTTFVHADVRSVSFVRPVDVWHDRATLHFLTERADQAAYARQAAAAIRPGGHLVLAVFAPDGPRRCSGLPVERHDESSLAALFHDGFTLVEAFERVHLTPGGTEQRFPPALFARRTSDRDGAGNLTAGS